MKADIEVQKQISTVLDNWLTHFQSGNLEELMKLFSSDEDVTVIGASLDQKQIGYENIKSQYRESLKQNENIISIDYENLIVSAKESIAWASADLKIKIAVDENNIALVLRLTAVFENRDNNWLMVQSHSSIPFNNV